MKYRERRRLCAPLPSIAILETSYISSDDRFAECKLTLVGGALLPPLAYVVIRVPFRLVKLTMPRALPHKSPCPSNGRL